MAIITRQTHIKRGCLRHHNSAGVTSLFASASGDKTLKLWNTIDDPGKSASDTIGSSVPQTFTLRKLRSFPTKSGLPGLSIIWNPGLHLLTVNRRIAEFGCAKSYRARDPWLGPSLVGCHSYFGSSENGPSFVGCFMSPLFGDARDSCGFHISSPHRGTVPSRAAPCSLHGGTVTLINTVTCELSGP